jgi:hypothetical protein
MFEDLLVFKNKLRQVFLVANKPLVAKQNIQRL